MFKYSTSTILNSLTDDNGVAKVVLDTTSGKESLTIHRLGKFTKNSVTKIYKRVGTNGTAGRAEITCETRDWGSQKNAGGVYRLKLYVKLSGSNNAFYANDFVFKGKPYAYEFKVADNASAANVATAAKEAIDKAAKRFGDKVFTVTTDTTKLTITVAGKDKEYISITECVLQKFDDTVNSALIGGEYRDIVECTVDGTLVTAAQGDTPAVYKNQLFLCVNPFGTYGEIIKDLRLPTPEHTGWTSLMSDEMPVANTLYNQYMIYMCKDRGVMGGDAVGQVAKSVTAHSIWIPQSLETTKVVNPGGQTVNTTLADAIATIGTVLSYNGNNLSNTQDNATAFSDKVSEADLAD